MEPIDRRVTAAQLMAMRASPNAASEIAGLLRVAEMPARLAARTGDDILQFILTGDAVLAAQLIHAAMVRGKTEPKQ